MDSKLLSKLEQADGLIFDMDGTLVDSMPLHFDAWLAVTRHYGLPFSESRFYQLGGVPTLQTLQILSSEAGKSIDITEAVKMKESFYQTILPKIKVIPETMSIVEQYAGDKPMGIATGASKKSARKLLSLLKIDHFFGTVVTADDVENHKPAPDVFIKAAFELGLAPSRCIAFEDTDIGLEAINRARMQGIDVRLLRGT